MRALHTVQNHFADFVLPELKKGQGFRVQFEAATKQLEDIYLDLMPQLEAAYGVKPFRDVIQLESGETLGFSLDFPLATNCRILAGSCSACRVNELAPE